VIVGHSDITSLLLGIHRQTGLVTFHGSSGFTGVGDYAIAHFRRAIMSTATIGEVAKPPKKSDGLVERNNRLITIVPGRATGQLVGGNLTLVTNLLGTPLNRIQKARYFSRRYWRRTLPYRSNADTTLACW
jgi:muramoyltetrapeptide carboxypeptidase